MRSGKLRDRATLRRPAQETDAFSESKGESTVRRHLPCAFRFLTGREAERAAQAEEVVTYEVRMRKHHGLTITPKYSLTRESDNLTVEVVSVGDPRNDNRELLLMCKESHA